MKRKLLKYIVKSKHHMLCCLAMIIGLNISVEVQAQGYNEHDTQKLVAFFIQESAEEGKKNWEQLELENEPTEDNVSEWASILQSRPVNTPLRWKNVNGEFRVDYMDLPDNKLGGSLDLSGFTALSILRCGEEGDKLRPNQFTNLNLSGCEALTDLTCKKIKLETLDLSGCYSLKVIHCKENLLTDLNVSDCTNLTNLYCNGNKLSELDLSNLSQLSFLHCHENALEEMNLSGCSSLYYVECRKNQLTSLDFTNCTRLNNLDCENNLLQELNLSGCTALETLNCSSNKLQSLTLTDCTALIDLYCRYNELQNLDLSENINLSYLWCNSNQLESMDLSGCKNLVNLQCHYNSLTSLDVSGNTQLILIYCQYNSLEKLDVTGCNSLTNLWCFDNAIPFSELPVLAFNFYIYSSQTITHPNAVYPGSRIDLTSMTVAGEDTKIFYNDVQVGSVSPGNEFFTIPAHWRGEIKLKMTNGLFPKFDLNYPFNYTLKVNAPIPYHTIHLEVASGINLYNMKPGELVIEEGGLLNLQFLPEDPSMTADNVLLIVDGVETPFKNLGGNYYFTYTLKPVTKDHSIVIALREYTVTLPDIEGVTSDIGPGEHTVAYGDSFTFSLTAKEGFDPGKIRVYVNGIEWEPDSMQGSTLHYTIDKVNGPITIEIKGAGDPVNNIVTHEPKAKVYSSGNSLIIETSTPSTVYVYTISGKQVTARKTVSDTTEIPLPDGIYLVQIGNETYKISIS